MSHSEASGSGKADSSNVPAQADTGNAPATSTGAGSSTDIAPNSSNNATPSEQAWTTVLPRRAPAIRGSGGSAAGAYSNLANRAVNTRGKAAWINGTSGRPTTPGSTTAMSSNSWDKGPPRKAHAASTISRSPAQADVEKPGRQYATTKPPVLGPTAVPPTAPYQGSTTRPPTQNWRGLNKFVTGKARAPASAPAQTVATGVPSGEPRSPVAAEAPLAVVYNTSTTGAATDTVVERASVEENSNEQTKVATDRRSETHGVQVNKSIDFPGNPHSLTNPLMVSPFSTF